MPLYEYQCHECRKVVEVLVRSKTERPECPKCGSTKLEKQLSVTASPAMASKNSLPTMQAGCGKPQCGSGGCAFNG